MSLLLLEENMEGFFRSMTEYAPYWQPFITGFLIIGSSLLALIFIALILVYNQLRVMNKSLKLQASINIFDEFFREDSVAARRSIYRKFCEDGFELKSSNNSEDIERNISIVMRSFEKLGILAREGIVRPDMLEFISDATIRSWLALNRISKTIEKRRDPLHEAGMEYLTILSLRFQVKRGRTELSIYHDQDLNKFKAYSQQYLQQKLQELEREVKSMKFHTI